MLGKRPVLKFLHRDREELYDVENDLDEVRNLAGSAEHQSVLQEFRKDTNEFRKRTGDIWMKYPLPSGEEIDAAFA